MNYVGHIAVGMLLTDEDGASGDHFLVGCALPDYAAMAGVRLRPKQANEYTSGIATHQACDVRFHQLAWFRHATAALRTVLLSGGFSRGAARAAAHILPELALDGRLMARDAVVVATGRVLEAVAAPDRSLIGLVDGVDVDRWRIGLERIGREGTPARYAEPEWLARRVVAATAGRPALRVSAAHIPMLADAADELLSDEQLDPDAILVATSGIDRPSTGALRHAG